MLPSKTDAGRFANVGKKGQGGRSRVLGAEGNNGSIYRPEG